LRSEKTITLSLDEWNVWRLSKYQNLPRATSWEPAPRVIEDEYDVADAVVLGNLLISILRRSDRVKIACLAQLVNVIAPIRAEVGHPAWRQTTFFPFSYTARYGRGKVLTTRIDSAKIKSEKYGEVNTVDSVVTYDEATDTAAIFLVNRSLTDSHSTDIDLAGFKDITILEQATLTDSNLKKTNTLATGEQVKPDTKITSSVTGNTISISLAPASWQMVRVSLKKD
jgi:alpha-N-arabinofuranosidase